mgnify:CR=1 FL=1
MATLTADEIRSRVETDWNRIVKVLAEKVALQSISAKGITAEHMKRSAEFVADELRLVGVDTKVVQASNADGTPGAWEVIGSHIVSPDAPTVLLYAHHDVQPVPDPAEWNTDPFVATEIDGRLYGRGSADDGGGIAIHSGALKALGDDLNVNIKVFIEGEEEMGSPSFIPFIEAHRDEFAADVIIVADSGNWSADIPSLTTSLRGNTCVDVTVQGLEHPVHSGQYGGPILDSNTLAAMLIASMYDENGDLAVPGVAALMWCVLMHDYQKQRVLTFLNPGDDPLGAGYHILQSRIAIGSGELWGKGYMEGMMNKLNFLPERHSDFALAVFGEEWGFVGCVALVTLFCLFLLSIFSTVVQAKDRFGSMLAVGVFFYFFWQICINMGMVIGLMPVVGIPLPFISYGGSATVVNFTLLGIVLNVSMRRFMFKS